MLSPLKCLALSKQGLLPAPTFGEGLDGTRKAIEHLGYVQIDTLSVVERAHHHVLWSRVPDYEQGHLNRLIAAQHIFEYWFHAAAYLPMRDYRFALPGMAAVRSGENPYFNGDPRLMNEILARVKGEGALRMRDIDSGKKSQGDWWNWGPGRRSVEKLFMQGELMVCERNGMEKVYDLAERCLPADVNQSMPSVEEYAEYLFDTTLRAHGVFTWKQLLHLRKGVPLRDAMRKLVAQRSADGIIKQITCDDGAVIYVDAKAMEQATSLEPQLKVLSPFDNALIHRDRLSSLFKFDYRIECYVPAAKRVYGYFCLPILYGDKFVARIDCKAHRSEQRFEILSLHLEEGVLDQARFFPALRAELQKFADFNKCTTLDLRALEM